MKLFWGGVHGPPRMPRGHVVLQVARRGSEIFGSSWTHVGEQPTMTFISPDHENTKARIPFSTKLLEKNHPNSIQRISNSLFIRSVLFTMIFFKLHTTSWLDPTFRETVSRELRRWSSTVYIVRVTQEEMSGAGRGGAAGPILGGSSVLVSGWRRSLPQDPNAVALPSPGGTLGAPGPQGGALCVWASCWRASFPEKQRPSTEGDESNMILVLRWLLKVTF